MVRYRIRLSLAGALIAIVSGSLAQPMPTPVVAPIFEADEVFVMRLAAPFAKVNRRRGDDREYFPARLTYTGAAGDEHVLQLRVRTRGKSRSDPKTCSFAPLMLNFDRDALGGTVFDGENRLKLVTHCKSDRKYAQYVLLEYLNYRVLQLFTDYALRVRRLEVSYFDTDKDRLVDTRPAFLIEDIGRMAVRLGLNLLEAERMDRAQYEQAQLNFVEVFEFFLGNTDWSAILGPPGESCCHNIIPLQTVQGLAIPVPYDFDATGMVNAPYSVPSESLSIRSVRQRLYRGFCQPDEIVAGTLKRFRDGRAAIEALYRQAAGLSERTIERTLEYVADFYSVINDPAATDKYLIDKCR